MDLNLTWQKIIIKKEDDKIPELGDLECILLEDYDILVIRCVRICLYVMNYDKYQIRGGKSFVTAVTTQQFQTNVHDNVPYCLAYQFYNACLHLMSLEM